MVQYQNEKWIRKIKNIETEIILGGYKLNSSILDYRRNNINEV